MKKSSLDTYLYSAAGVVAMLLIAIAVNVIAARAKLRVDLTAERAYTLSPGTRAILKKLDTPVTIRFYATRNDNSVPAPLKAYAQRVDDLLGEFRQASNGQIEIQRLNPAPDSDAEDSARLDGVTPQPLRDGERLYLGLSVSMLDQKETIAFLSPNRERLLEYDLARAVSRVLTTEKPVVGVMSSLPVAGSKLPPGMSFGPQRGGEPPWVFYSELERDFTVKQVELTAETIPDDIKVLLVIHPKGIAEATQYALDQFVLRGGKLIAFIDPLAVLDRNAAQRGGMMPAASSSTLDKLLPTWGLAMDATKVVADANYTSRTRQGRSATILSLTERALNRDDLLTAEGDTLLMGLSGAITGKPADGLKMVTLIRSSGNSQLVDAQTAQMSGEETAANLAPAGVEYALAVRLTGKFKTAFPNGKPGKAPEPPKPADAAATPTPTPTPAAAEPAALKESAAENTVILVADSDMLQDQAAVNEAGPSLGGQRFVIPVNGNLAFAQGAVEQGAGDSNLISVRSRAVRERPFLVVKEMQSAAEANSRSKIKEMEASLADAQRRLGELQRGKDSGQKFILSPEQQQEIANFRKKEGEVRQALKVERKKLRADIDSLENRLKWMNIALMPALVAASGVGLAVARRRREAPR